MVDLAGYGEPTPGETDPEAVIERWEEIEERGHPLGPDDPATTNKETYPGE